MQTNKKQLVNFMQRFNILTIMLVANNWLNLMFLGCNRETKTATSQVKYPLVQSVTQVTIAIQIAHAKDKYNISA